VRFSKSSALAFVAALFVAGAPALASEDDAKTLFASGRELRTAGRCADAILQFRRALEVFPQGLGALRNIAECEEQLGQYAAARRDWWDLRRAVMQSNEPKYAGWDRDAEQAHVRLAAKVARVVVRLAGARTERVEIQVDGKPLDPRLVGVELERDLGPHVVQASYGGAAPVTARITLAEGAREVVTLTIPALAPPAEKPAAPAAPPAPEPARGSPALRTAGYVALGAGALGLVGTIASVAVRGSALRAVEGACPSYETQPCPASVGGDVDRGKTASLLANVFGGVALAGLGVGVTLIAVGWGPGAQPASAGKAARATLPATTVTLVPAPGGALAHAEVRF
jgi:hypothetical protein